MKTTILFLVTALIYAVLDLLFINVFARAFIRRQVGHLLADKPDWAAGIVFYVLFTGGLLYFAVMPADSMMSAVKNGAFLGLLCYGTYELVNKALISGWPISMVWVDLAWGLIAGALTSGLAWWLKGPLNL
jgi:uncharacterized membrane protein